jgi:hypothetical protein
MHLLAKMSIKRIRAVQQMPEEGTSGCQLQRLVNRWIKSPPQEPAVLAPRRDPERH